MGGGMKIFEQRSQATEYMETELGFQKLRDHWIKPGEEPKRIYRPIKRKSGWKIKATWLRSPTRGIRVPRYEYL